MFSRGRALVEMCGIVLNGKEKENQTRTTTEAVEKFCNNETLRNLHLLKNLPANKKVQEWLSSCPEQISGANEISVVKKLCPSSKDTAVKCAQNDGDQYPAFSKTAKKLVDYESSVSATTVPSPFSTSTGTLNHLHVRLHRDACRSSKRRLFECDAATDLPPVPTVTNAETCKDAPAEISNYISSSEDPIISQGPLPVPITIVGPVTVDEDGSGTILLPWSPIIPAESIFASQNSEDICNVPEEIVVHGTSDLVNTLITDTPSTCLLGDPPLATPNGSGTHTSSSKRTRKYTPPENPTRKRSTNADRWKKTLAKNALDRGEEHLNIKGQVIKAREIGESCGRSCRYKCYERVHDTDRQQIFQEFWKKTQGREHKWGYISRLVRCHAKKSSTSTGTADDSRRAASRAYNFRIKGEFVRVCKTMFLSTLGICDGWITTSLKKLGEGGDISPEKRGKGRSYNGPKISPETIDSVRRHINVFPRVESHYIRAHSQREYLHQEVKSVSNMYELYCEWIVEEMPGIKKASERQYRDIFNTQFNISFYVPKKDQCDQCTEYDNAENEEKQALENDYQRHIANKDIVQNMKNADAMEAKKKESQNLCVACFDFEKTLIAPKGEVSSFYYKTKLAVNNFTVADVGRFEGTCYVYDETTAKKGGNEVASLLLHYIESKVNQGISEFRTYSDNCGGQNKNKHFGSLLNLVATKFNIKITHTYLEKGHTYNEADQFHSLIERRSKNTTIYTPTEWYNLIKTAKRSKTNSIRVIEVTQDMIFDFQDLSNKQNFRRNTSGQPVPWREIRQISACESSPNKLMYKVEYKGEPFHISLNSVGRPVNVQTYVLTTVFDAPLKIKHTKYIDLKTLCKTNAIPPRHHAFFLALPHEELPDKKKGREPNPTVMETSRAYTPSRENENHALVSSANVSRLKKRTLPQSASAKPKRAKKRVPVEETDDEDDPDYIQ